MLTKAKLVADVAEATGLPKRAVEEVIETAAVAIAFAVASGPAIVPGLGRLHTVYRQGRTGRDPRTGAPLQIPGRRVVRFAPTFALKQFVAGE